MSDDTKYMKRALSLARRGMGTTSPNPMVGAIIVKDSVIVGKGYHKRAGYPHAEIVALKEAGEKARGATLYINLEPCSHSGRTPPCVDSIIEYGIKRVVASMVDPYPLVSGSGIGRLKENGIEVEVGVLGDEARKLNEVYIKYITDKLPFVTLTLLSTLDGRIVETNEYTKKIIDKKAYLFVQELRDTVDAVMVEFSTSITNFSLPRLKKSKRKRKPLLVIVDPFLQIPEKELLETDMDNKMIMIAVSDKADEIRVDACKRKKREILILDHQDSGMNIRGLLEELGKKEITSLLVEGRGDFVSCFLHDDLIDKIHIFYIPKILGEENGVSMISNLKTSSVKEGVRIRDIKLKRFDYEIMIQGYVEHATPRASEIWSR
ncbi:MAG: bifunctional diaminohydroxyphosphoribosylaminopyrimidine deaminase/5-amino-6-(5-phosphoribosylamino)uracil reductase RibD [Thermodesulfobacteriota bacterium]|nr:bifunctional diaminohydroxyphosphoribosylaminopyrimidine deaminase/5-amino-6-(5-phosphoribosylamino)uracil reductase RibD [Thermodesulfobacteriota bacterium]